MWGTGAAADVIAPSKSGDETFRAWWARAERLGSAVNQVAAILRVLLLQDVRALLPTLAVPTLVLHRVGNVSVPVGAGRYLVDQIPGANYVELPGDDAMFFVGDTDALLDGIEEFLTGSRQAPEGDVVYRDDPVHRHRRFDRTVRPHGSPQMDRADRRARCHGARHLGALPGP